jgi:hypothetical protein
LVSVFLGCGDKHVVTAAAAAATAAVIRLCERVLEVLAAAKPHQLECFKP